MKTAIPQPLLHSLIKYDLINTKLILSLNKLGLDADDYLTNLSTGIFTLMGYSNDERERETLYEGYRELAERVLYIDTRNWYGALDDLAAEIYTYLRHYPKTKKKKY